MMENKTARLINAPTAHTGTCCHSVCGKLSKCDFCTVGLCFVLDENYALQLHYTLCLALGKSRVCGRQQCTASTELAS